MHKILLVRPGATEYDRQGRIQGTLDIPLSEDGKQQVEAAVPAITSGKPVALYHSPCQSAEQTAEVLAKALKLKAKEVESLHNLDHGLWQGMLIEDVRSKQPKVYRQWQEQPQTVCPPQGETVMEAMQRISTILKKLVKKHRSDETIAIVAPEPLASVIRHVIRQDDLRNFWKPPEGCGGWESIELPAELAGVS